MVRTLEFYGYDDTAFMRAIKRCCPGCHFEIKVDEDGILHLVNGVLSADLEVVYSGGTISLYDKVNKEVVGDGIDVAELFQDITSGQTFITSAVTSESGITFYVSDILGESGSTIELPLPTLSIVPGDGIDVTTTDSGTVISLSADIADEIDELVAFSGEVVSALTEVENALEEAASAINEVSSAVSGHTDAINELSAETKDIADEVSALTTSAQTLNGKIEQEISDRESADDYLEALIDAEKNARTDADAALSGEIDTETAARETGDANLAQDIANEAAAREAADTYISGAITAISAVTDDLEPRVATNEGNINILSGEVATFESGLTEEINDRVSGDSIAMDYIESGVGYVIDSLSSTVKNFIEDEYAALSAMVQSLSDEVTELKNLSGTAQSYDDFIAPYNYSDIAGLLKRICDALGIEP